MKINGPGLYDDLATDVRTKARAAGVMVIVFGGAKGHGFSCQLPADLLILVPEILRDTAAQIEQQLREES